MSTARSSTATASTLSTESPEAAAEIPGWAGWEVIVVAAALLVGLWLRLNGYASVPPITQNADELQFAWLGLSLWHHGEPLTWAYFGPYAAPHVIHLHGTTYPLVHPWFDHPPLFGLITGGAALLAGQSTFAAVDMSAVRLPPIAFATLTIPLIHALGRRALSPQVAAVGAVLVAISPPLVLLARVAEPESLLAPMFLAGLLLAVRRLSAPRRRWEWLLFLGLCVLAPLAKVTGLGLGGVLAVAFIVNGRTRDAALCAGAGLVGLGIFAAYGAAFGWQTFLDVLAAQSAHRAGVMGGLEFVAAFAGNNHHLYDGWWLLGWLGIALLAMQAVGRAGLWIAWPVAAYLAMIVVLANQQWVGTYGWYRVAVYPLVYLAAAELAWRLISAPSPAISALVLSLGGATATAWWLGTPWVPPAWLAVAVFAAVVLPSLRWPALARRAGIAALGLMAAGCLVQSLLINDLANRL